jgi:hypothetical protein
MTPAVNGAIQVHVVVACIAKDRRGTGLAWEQRLVVCDAMSETIDEGFAIMPRVARRAVAAGAWPWRLTYMSWETTARGAVGRRCYSRRSSRQRAAMGSAPEPRAGG